MDNNKSRSKVEDVDVEGNNHSNWARDWLLHGERLRHSHYYNLMESLQEKDSGSEFMAGCFDQTSAFFLLAFQLWPLVVTSVSETVLSETGCVCWGRGWFDFTLPLPFPPNFLPHFDIVLDVYTKTCFLAKCWRINYETTILASTRFVIFSFIRRSQAFTTFAKAFVSIRNIRKGLARNSAHCL